MLRFRRAQTFDQEREQQLDIEPSDERIATLVGHAVQAAQTFPALVKQFHLPPQTIGPQAALGRHAPRVGRRQQHDVVGHLQRGLGHVARALFFAQARAGAFRFVRR